MEFEMVPYEEPEVGRFGRRLRRGFRAAALGPLAAAGPRGRRMYARPSRGGGGRPTAPVTTPGGLIAGSGRGGLLPLGQVVVPQSSTATLTANVQRPFQAERLIITAAATGLLLTDYSVGTVRQLAGNGASPVEAFAADSVNSDIQTDPAGPGTEISLTFQNPTAADISVSAALFGVLGG